MKYLLNIMVFVGLFASCEKLAGDQNVTSEDLDKQLAEIEMFIEAGTCSEDTQCGFMPYGSKACGGPQGFLVFSTDIDTDELRKMVERYNRAEDTYNKENGIMSDCSLPPEPQQLACEDGNCIEVK